MSPSATPPPSLSPSASKRTKRAPWGWIIAGVMLFACIGGFLVVRAKTAPVAGQAGGGPGGRGGRQMGPTPVATTPARKGDLRVYQTALGSVTPLSTAAVRSRADGELLKIHFTEGQPVKAGDLLAEIDPRSYEVALQQAKGQLARDRASLENARLDLKRYESAQEAVTQQQIDTARATVAELEGTVLADEGNVANAQLQLSYCRVVAPIAGRTGLRQVDVGNLVRASDATGLVVITQEQPIAVIFSIPEDSLPAIGKAMVTGQQLTVEAYDRAMKSQLAAGKLTAVDNQIDSTTGTVRLKSTFANDDHSLFPNQFVNVRLLVSVLRDATLIPASAIQVSAQNRFAFVVTAEGTVQRRQITTGPSEGELTSVVEGIKAGDNVVVEGLDRLQDGAKVSAREKSAAPAAGGARPVRNVPTNSSPERKNGAGKSGRDS